MSGASTIAEPKRVFYGAQEVAQNPGIIDFSFEAAFPFDADRFPVRVRSTWNGIEEIRGHIARLEERALQAEANLRHFDAERRLQEKDVALLKEGLTAVDLLTRAAERDVERAVLAEARAEAAERAAHEANETLRSLRSDQFACETLVPVGDVDGGGNVWVRLRSTEEGAGMLLKQLFRLDERSVLAEARALAAEAKLAVLEANQADALASVAGFEVLPADATTYTVSHGGATMTVTGSPSGVANVVKLAYGGFEYGVSA